MAAAALFGLQPHLVSLFPGRCRDGHTSGFSWERFLCLRGASRLCMYVPCPIYQTPVCPRASPTCTPLPFCVAMYMSRPAYMCRCQRAPEAFWVCQSIRWRAVSEYYIKRNKQESLFTFGPARDLAGGGMEPRVALGLVSSPCRSLYLALEPA